jgi:hypothetical protein
MAWHGNERARESVNTKFVEENEKRNVDEKRCENVVCSNEVGRGFSESKGQCCPLIFFLLLTRTESKNGIRCMESPLGWRCVCNGAFSSKKTEPKIFTLNHNWFFFEKKSAMWQH